MNTEQLKTAEEILISKVGKLALSGLKWKSLNDRKQLIIEAMQDLASQESKRAVDEFKEKLRNELLNARLWVDPVVNKSNTEHVVKFIDKL